MAKSNQTPKMMSDQSDMYRRPSDAEARRMERERSEIIGRNALDTCFELLRETLEADNVSRETPPPPCEHDYQPSTRFLEAVECTKCGDISAGESVEWYDERKSK